MVTHEQNCFICFEHIYEVGCSDKIVFQYRSAIIVFDVYVTILSRGGSIWTSRICAHIYLCPHILVL